MSINNPFERSIPVFSRLQSQGDGFLVTYGPENGTSSSFFISNADLAQTDIRLPEALRLIERAQGKLQGLHVALLFQLWAAPFEFMTTTGELVALHNVRKISSWDDAISIKGDGHSFTKQRHSVTGEIFRAYVGSAPIVSAISKEWLNQQYPGWFERYSMAENLGAEVQDAALALFNCFQPSATHFLPNDFGL